MKEVAIKYNPYMVKTEIAIDGKMPAGNSWYEENSEKRLQEWVDVLPQKLVEEENDTEFHIKFHGTTPDLEDVRDSLDFAVKDIDGFSYTLEHIPAKEVADKKAKIREVFEKIQSIKGDEELGDLQELTSGAVVDAFNNALNNDFEVFVVATMSAGKSTLINAMLGRKLMPSKQEACTALITRIKDSDGHKDFSAVAYDSLNGGEVKRNVHPLSLKDMEELNGRGDVRRIEVTGDIPFVGSDEVSLVLIDTPGPNNSRTTDHGEVQRQMLDDKAKPLILYVMTGEYGTEDDKAVLNRVADSMSKGGKQSRDRFLFVVNKLDGRKEEDGELDKFLDTVRNYLMENGIPDPNIFPAGALAAMNIRLLAEDALTNENDIDETELNIRKFNRNPGLHFEKVAQLPRRVKAEIDKKLESVIAEWPGKPKDNPDAALIHTGIPSVEAAIRLYVEKYARTAKIKTLVDTFVGRLESLGKLAELQNAIVTNEKNKKDILKKITEVRAKQKKMEDAKNFETQVDQAVKAVVTESGEKADILVSKLFKNIASKYASRADETIELDEVDDEVRSMQRFANRCQEQFKEELDTLIQEQLVATGERLVEEYKAQLTELGSEINLSSSSIKFDPSALMAGELDDQVLTRAAIKALEREEQVKSGEEWVKNTNKKWWKPWTWVEEKGYWRTTYKTRRFIRIQELAETYF
ncbi:dynamin family protein, partial [Desulfovibrio sp.]|uniref:dynamin family protein n=1 Tax=Desulfovibrio sp. TaxID=885 RepID=UPI0023C38643